MVKNHPNYGIGTTIFCVSDLLMVLGAGAILVAQPKADEE